MSASEHRNHPDYAEGFWDAQAGEPLFDGASAPYRAGWEAQWRVRETLIRNGLLPQPDGSYVAALTLYPEQSQ